MTYRYDTNLSGLELMQKLGKLAMQPGLEAMVPMIDAKTVVGKTSFKAKVDERHLNPFGIVLGGFTCTLLDAAAAMAAHSTVAPNHWIGTVDLNVRFLRSIKFADDLLVEGWVVHSTKQLIVAESRVLDDQERMLATASGIFLVKRTTS